MKLNKIITVAGLVVLVALGTSCQSKKAKEAAERAAAEAAARAAAEAAAAAAKPAPVFELSDAVKAVAGELVADDAERTLWLRQLMAQLHSLCLQQV